MRRRTGRIRPSALAAVSKITASTMPAKMMRSALAPAQAMTAASTRLMVMAATSTVRRASLSPAASPSGCTFIGSILAPQRLARR
jgi:hypothetical protein